MTAKAYCSGPVVREQGLEDLLDRQADLPRHVDGGEVFGIDLVLLQRVGDAEPLEDAGGVGLHRAGRPLG